jgi:hypothetical protein
MQRTRDGGERWLTPLSFECTPSFFYPHESTTRKIFMNMLHLRKKILNKKKPLSPSNYNKFSFENLEDFISIELDANNQENLIHTDREQQQINEQQEHLSLFSTRKLKGALTNRWINGVRR